jgi:serine/threonine protein kinase
MDDKASYGPYLLVDAVGRGAFGTVFKAVHRFRGNWVAIKRVTIQKRRSEAQLTALMSEIDLLKHLRHRNIVEYIDHGLAGDALYIVMEYVEAGSLYAMVRKHGRFPEPLVAAYMRQLLAGLQFLHSTGVIHRDIKGANILVSTDGTAKLADFGVSTKVTEITSGEEAFAGTPYWMAPEIITMSGATTACDIWSIGCTVIELLTGEPPYAAMTPTACLYRIVQDDHPPIPDGISRPLRDLLLQCFQKDVDRRITAARMLLHPWVKHHSDQFPADVPRSLSVAASVPSPSPHTFPTAGAPVAADRLPPIAASPLSAVSAGDDDDDGGGGVDDIDDDFESDSFSGPSELDETGSATVRKNPLLVSGVPTVVRSPDIPSLGSAQSVETLDSIGTADSLDTPWGNVGTVVVSKVVAAEILQAPASTLANPQSNRRDAIDWSFAAPDGGSLESSRDSFLLDISVGLNDSSASGRRAASTRSLGVHREDTVSNGDGSSHGAVLRSGGPRELVLDDNDLSDDDDDDVDENNNDDNIHDDDDNINDDDGDDDDDEDDDDDDSDWEKNFSASTVTLSSLNQKLLARQASVVVSPTESPTSVPAGGNASDKAGLNLEDWMDSDDDGGEASSGEKAQSAPSPTAAAPLRRANQRASLQHSSNSSSSDDIAQIADDTDLTQRLDRARGLRVDDDDSADAGDTLFDFDDDFDDIATQASSETRFAEAMRIQEAEVEALTLLERMADAKAAESDVCADAERLSALLAEVGGKNKHPLVSNAGLSRLLAGLDAHGGRAAAQQPLLHVVNELLRVEGGRHGVHARFCVLGAIPVVTAFASPVHSVAVRGEVAQFVLGMVSADALAIQMFVAAGGPRALVWLLEVRGPHSGEVAYTCVRALWHLFNTSALPRQQFTRNDMCHLFARAGLIPQLAAVLRSAFEATLAGDSSMRRPAPRAIAESLSMAAGLLEHFSLASMDAHVLEQICRADVLEALCGVLRRGLERPTASFFRVLQSVKVLSQLPGAIDALGSSGIVELLVRLLSRRDEYTDIQLAALGHEREPDRKVSELRKMQLWSMWSLCNLCALSRALQERAVVAGALPELVFYSTVSFTRVFAIRLLLVVPLASSRARDLFWEQDAFPAFRNLLRNQSESYFVDCVFCLDRWQNVDDRLLPRLLEEETARLLVATFAFYRTAAFARAVEPLQKLVQSSAALAARIVELDGLAPVLAALRSDKVLVLKNVLSIVRDLLAAVRYDPVLTRAHDLESVLRPLCSASEDRLVLVRGLADSILTSAAAAADTNKE